MLYYADSLVLLVLQIKEDLATAHSRIEELHSSKNKLDKKLQREIVDLKALVRKEHEAKTEVLA